MELGPQLQSVDADENTSFETLKISAFSAGRSMCLPGVKGVLLYPPGSCGVSKTATSSGARVMINERVRIPTASKTKIREAANRTTHPMISRFAGDLVLGFVDSVMVGYMFERLKSFMKDCPTACVTRGWAGRDNAALAEPTSSQKTA